MVEHVFLLSSVTSAGVQLAGDLVTTGRGQHGTDSV